MTTDIVTKQLGGARLPDEDALKNGIHVFTAGLLIVAIGTSFQMSLRAAVTHLVLIVLFAVVYFLGSIHVDEWPDFRKQVWMLALTMVWICDMVVAPVGIYLVFTLYFVYLQVFDEIQGLISVVFATAVSIIMQMPGGLTFGGLMGPAVSAFISLAIHYAFKTISRISHEREVLIDQLMETREELAQSQHDAGVIAERQRLGHEIHDTVAQGLSSIQLLLHAAEREVKSGHTEKALERIDQARSASAENLSEARALIAALQPSSLVEGTLSSALERMAKSFGAAGDVSIDVDTEGTPIGLPMKIEATLLRIAQGAVGNVIKHAEASKARITVTYNEDSVRLDVVDNGKGFDPASIPVNRTELGHVGLAAIRQRAEELGAELVIESRIGGPTAISVEFALDLDN